MLAAVAAEALTTPEVASIEIPVTVEASDVFAIAYLVPPLPSVVVKAGLVATRPTVVVISPPPPITGAALIVIVTVLVAVAPTESVANTVMA